MTECITTIRNGYLYIPKKYLVKAGIRENTKVVLRVTEHGIALTKINVLDDVNLFFNELDEGLQRLFIKQKSKQKPPS